MSKTWTIFKRELAGYFLTPVAYIFICFFLFLVGLFTFAPFLGNLYGRDQADLRPLFTFLPWLFLFLIPAISMRLWAEERKVGTLELLMTLPVSLSQAVLGKYLAAWCFAGIALFLTFPAWVSVAYLGDPDNGVIFASYLGAFLMSGGFLAIGACISALTRNQVIAFVVTVVVCLLFIVSGFPLALDFLHGFTPAFIIEALSGLSFLTHFDAISKGVIDLRDLLFFISMIVVWLFANAVVLDLKKAD